MSNNNLKQLNKVVGKEVRFPSMKALYADRDACMNHLFSSVELEMQYDSNEDSMKPATVVFCTNIKQLIDEWCGATFDTKNNLVTKVRYMYMYYIDNTICFTNLHITLGIC